MHAGAVIGVCAAEYLNILALGIDGQGLPTNTTDYAAFVSHIEAGNKGEVRDNAGAVRLSIVDQRKQETAQHRIDVKNRVQASEQAARDKINSVKMWKVPPSAENPQGIPNPDYTGPRSYENAGIPQNVPPSSQGIVQVVDASTGLVMNPVLPADNNGIPTGAITTPNQNPGIVPVVPIQPQKKNKFWFWVAAGAAALAILK